MEDDKKWYTSLPTMSKASIVDMLYNIRKFWVENTSEYIEGKLRGRLEAQREIKDRIYKEYPLQADDIIRKLIL